MENLKRLSLVFFLVSMLTLATVGAMDCINWVRLGLVTRPALISIYDPEDVGQPVRPEVIQEARRAQGIPEGRNHK